MTQFPSPSTTTPITTTTTPSLICDVLVWSAREEQQATVPDNDLACFRLHQQQEASMLSRFSTSAQDKRTFAEGRGIKWFVDGPKAKAKSGGGSHGGKRLKGSTLRELEDALLAAGGGGDPGGGVAFGSFRTSAHLQLLMANGLLANLYLDKSGNLDHVSYDKFLVGKLMDFVTDVAFTEKVMVVTYMDSRVTLVASAKKGGLLSYSNLAANEAKVHLIDMLGPAGRRLRRRVQLSSDSSLALFWWSMPDQEVFPWAPSLRDEDRANVMLYSLKSPANPSRLGFIRTNTDPIGFRFLSESTGAPALRYVGQDAARLQVENSVLYTHTGDCQLRRKSFRKLDVSPVSCHAFVNDNLVLLGTAEGNILLMDLVQNRLECQTRCSFVPAALRIHPDRTIFVAVSSERGFLQVFDIALNPIRLSFPQDQFSLNGTKVLDLGQYASWHLPSPPLAEAFWCCRRNSRGEGLGGDATCDMEINAQNYLCIRFQSGPLMLVRIRGGAFGSPSPGMLGPVQITNFYLAHDLYNQVLLLLNQLDWATNAQNILICINNTFNKLSKSLVSGSRSCQEVEALMEMCLGLFYAPSRTIQKQVLEEHSDTMHDLTRRFFHLLLRRNRAAKAFQLAVDINDYDLFIDLYHSASKNKMPDLASASMIKAKKLFLDELHSSDTSSAVIDEETVPSALPEDNAQGHQPHLTTGLEVGNQSRIPMPGAEPGTMSDIGPRPLAKNPMPEGMMPSTSPRHLPKHLDVMAFLGDHQEFDGAAEPNFVSNSAPGPLQLASTGFLAAGVAADGTFGGDAQPESLMSTTSTFSGHLQPQLDATFQQTTSAKLINTNEYNQSRTTAVYASDTKVPVQDGAEGPILRASPWQSSKAREPNMGTLQMLQVARPGVTEEDSEDIQVIHFGIV